MANPNFTKILENNNAADDEDGAKAGSDHLSIENWQRLASKEHLTPMEMMQEAAFTELINKESLERLQLLEDENKN